MLIQRLPIQTLAGLKIDIKTIEAVGWSWDIILVILVTILVCKVPQGERNIGWSSFLWLRELFREMQLWIVSSHLTFPATGRMSASILKVHLSKPDDTGSFIAKVSLYPLFCSATFVIDQVTKCVGLVLKSILFYWSLWQFLRQYIQHF